MYDSISLSVVGVTQVLIILIHQLNTMVDDLLRNKTSGTKKVTTTVYYVQIVTGLQQSIDFRRLLDGQTHALVVQRAETETSKLVV